MQHIMDRNIVERLAEEVCRVAQGSSAAAWLGYKACTYASGHLQR